MVEKGVKEIELKQKNNVDDNANEEISKNS